MSLVSDFKNADLIIKRAGTGAYVDGRYVPGSIVEINDVKASVQQATPNEVALLPENRRGGETLVVYTEIQLKPTDEGPAQTKGDLFDYLGSTFEVHKTENWDTHFDLSHFRSIAVKQDDQAGADRGP